MSCRHPDTNTKTAKDAKTYFTSEFLTFAAFAIFAVERRRSVRNGRHLPRTERLEIAPRVLEIELRVARLDAEEEPVPAREREPRDVEHRMIRLRQAVQRQHPEHRRQRGAEDRHLERHRNERR